MAGCPAYVCCIAGIVLEGAVGGPAVEDGSSDEAEVEGELTGTASCSLEVDVVAVDEDEGVLGWRTVDSLLDAVEEGIFLESGDLLQDDMFFGVGPKFKASE
jgi:hypothetical protein